MADEMATDLANKVDAETPSVYAVKGLNKARQKAHEAVAALPATTLTALLKPEKWQLWWTS